MFADYIEKANFQDTGFSYTLSLISGKYKMVILYCLMEFQVVRYNELKRYIRTISHKTLSAALKELERDGLIRRKEYPQIPPKVEYSLSEKGGSLMEILDQLCVWGGAAPAGRVSAAPFCRPTRWAGAAGGAQDMGCSGGWGVLPPFLAGKVPFRAKFLFTRLLFYAIVLGYAKKFALPWPRPAVTPTPHAACGAHFLKGGNTTMMQKDQKTSIIEGQPHPSHGHRLSGGPGGHPHRADQPTHRPSPDPHPRQPLPPRPVQDDR